MVKVARLSELQTEILKARYALPTEETWEETARRTANWITSCEDPDRQKEILDLFLNAILPMDFVPGGRVLYGSGRPKPQLLNCFAFKVDDNAVSIGKLMNDVYRTSVAFGGCGINYGPIRPKGDPLQGVKGAAPGVVSEVRKIDAIGQETIAGGARRGAYIAILHVLHPDLLEFLHSKLDLNQLRNHNISVIITDEFLKAARRKEQWLFKFEGRSYRIWKLKRKGYRRQNEEYYLQEDEIQVAAPDAEDAVIRAKNHFRLDESDEFEVLGEKTIRADEILELLAENAWKCGEPGIINESLIKKNFATSYFESFACVNPCTEAVLPDRGNCCLGSINLAHMFDETTGDVNWKKLARTIRTGVRFLDNVLTVNQYPLQNMREVSHKSRRIGLGVMGLAYLYIKMGLKYGSESALEFTDRLMKTIRDEAFKASIQLAKEKGSFSAFDPEKYLENNFIQNLPPDIQEDIREHGIRNAVMLSIAPNGTISLLAGCSSSIEPIYSAVYKRRFRKHGTVAERLVVDPLFKKYFEENQDLSNFVGSHIVPGEAHIKTVARIQKYVDQSISKTVNVAENITPQGIANYILKYAPHIKGWTIFRENSRTFPGLGGAPLEAVDIQNMSKEEIMRLIQKSEDRSSTQSCGINKEGCDF